MKEIYFILSSLNDSHFRKRVEEFLDHGYHVKVYGFKRRGQSLPPMRYTPIVLGEIENRNFSARLSLLFLVGCGYYSYDLGRSCFTAADYTACYDGNGIWHDYQFGHNQIP